MITINGTWKFNDILYLPSEIISISQSVKLLPISVPIEIPENDMGIEPGMHTIACVFDTIAFTRNSDSTAMGGSEDKNYWINGCWHYYAATLDSGTTFADGEQDIYDYNYYGHADSLWTTSETLTITFDGEQEVSTEFYNWFIANATPIQSVAEKARAAAKVFTFAATGNGIKLPTKGKLLDRDIIVTGNGSGVACNKKHVTELEELPTDGLVEGEIYKVKKKALLSLALYEEDGLFIDYFGFIVLLLGALYGIEDGELPEGFYRYSKEIPTDTPDVSDLGAFCYVESEDMLYGYNPETLTWVSAATEEWGTNLPYIGAITSLDQITEYGLYAYLGYEGTEFYEIMPESYKIVMLINGTPMDVNMIRPCEVTIVPTLPTENIKTSSDKSVHCYYAEDQQEVFIHDGNEWMLCSAESEMSFGGLITSMGQATDEEKFYVLTNNGGLVDYFHPEASLKISAAGTYDVTKYAMVNANIPTHAIYGKRKIPLTNIPYPLTVPINFTTTYQGEIINCTHMKFDWGLMDDGVSIYYIKEDGESIYVFYDGLNAGDVRGASCLYVDFGDEPQLVVKEFADYMAQSIPMFETTQIPDITFTIDGVEYSDVYAISWHEFAVKTEGFTSYGYWYTYVYAGTSGYVYYNGALVNARDAIINGATYVTAGEGTITFTINGAKYFAGEGMDWLAWTDSYYNTDGYTIGADNSVLDENGATVMLSGANVTATDVITANTAYDYSDG
jgi:hypothetical protein